MRKLIYLDLSLLNAVDNDLIQSLHPEYFQSLRELSISGCVNLTSKGFGKFLQTKVAQRLWSLSFDDIMPSIKIDIKIEIFEVFIFLSRSFTTCERCHYTSYLSWILKMYPCSMNWTNYIDWNVWTSLTPLNPCSDSINSWNISSWTKSRFLFSKATKSNRRSINFKISSQILKALKFK